MKKLAAAALLAVAAIALLPSVGLAEGLPPIQDSGVHMIVEYLDRVELQDETAVVVFEVEGQEHEVEVDLAEIGEGLGERLTDDETDMVDIAALPVIGGFLLKIAGFLLRLGRL